MFQKGAPTATELGVSSTISPAEEVAELLIVGEFPAVIDINAPHGGGRGSGACSSFPRVFKRVLPYYVDHWWPERRLLGKVVVVYGVLCKCCVSGYRSFFLCSRVVNR